MTTLALLVSAVVQSSKGKLSLYAILVTYLTVLHTMASYTVACLNRNVALGFTYLRLQRRGIHYTWLGLSVEMVMAMYLQSIMVCTFGLYVWAKAA